jgi:hypothetical protein
MNKIKFIGCVIIALLYEARSFAGSLIEINIVFEVLSLILVILKERDKTMPELLF